MGRGSVQATINLKTLLDVSQVKAAVGNIQNALNGITMPKNLSGKVEKALQNIETEFTRIEQLQKQEFGNFTDADTILKSSDKILHSYTDIAVAIKQLGVLSDKELVNLFPQNVSDNIKQAQKALIDYEKEIKKISDDQKKLEKNLAGAIQAKNDKKGYQVVPDKEYNDWLQQRITLEGTIDGIRKNNRALQREASKTATSSKRKNEISKELQNNNIKITQFQQQLNDLEATKIKISISQTAFDALDENIKQAQDALDNFLQNPSNSNALQKLFTELQKIDGIDLANVTQDLDGAKEAISKLQINNIEQLRQVFKQLGITLDSTEQGFREFGTQTDGAKNKLSGFKQEAQELAQFKSRLLDFFGINNAINLFQRAVRDAYDTVKELDAAMTETAVVTPFSVGDMWDQLPRYTEEANKLGATTLGAYETMTLYFQQGLEANEAFALGTETMKMARIANMEYADATEMMTAAIRGFNMALNETSAQRVNDVYSELAAITAADTEQIATAMTKTASIANSANMEFETTAALLSQIIETTQEAPETAGTAMKTIIARFTEVKQLFSQGQLTGKDSEGEAININKIDEALKSVGMSLQGFLRGEQGIDDIFLELASKWDTLDLSTQRYIATMAAGSRQQSRFIAMMSDYERTMELVSAANNSAGASQRQFDKTLDSLEAKLNKLKNAWDQFTMGLANNSLIKAGVDTLTAIITAANNLTKIFGGSLLGSIVKVGLAIKGLSLGKMGVTGLGSLMGKAAQTKQGAAVYKALGLETLLGKIVGEGKAGGGITTGQKIVSSSSTFAQTIISAANTFKGIVTGSGIKQRAMQAPQQLQEIGSAIKEFLTGDKALTKYFKYEKYLAKPNVDSNGNTLVSVPKILRPYTDKNGNLPQNIVDILLNERGGLLGTLGNSLAKKGFFQQGLLNKFVTKGPLSKLTGLLTGALGGSAGVGGAAAALAGLATTLTVVGVAGWAAYKGIKALYDASPEGQVKQAEKLADTIGEVADKANQQANEIKGLYDAYQTNQQAIKDASNLDEYREAINASNEQVMQMMESHPDLITSDMIEFKDGQITLISDKFEDAVDQFETAAENLRFADTYAQANELYKRAAVYKADAEYHSDDLLRYPKESPYRLDIEQKRDLALLKEESTRAQADALAASAYYNLIGDAVKEAGYGDALASAVTKAWGANKEIQIKFLRSELDGDTINEKFESITGLPSGDYGDEYKKNTIAMDQFREARYSNLQEIESLFLKNQESVGTLLKFLDGTYKGELAQGENVTRGQFTAALNLDLEGTDFEELIKLLGFSLDEKAENYFFDYANKQTQEYEKMRSALRKELYTSLFSYAGKTSYSIDPDAILGLDVESQERMMSFMDTIQHFSDEDKGAAWAFMPEIVKDADKFASVIDSINFQNPIAMAKDLKNIIKDDTHVAYEFADALLKSESQFLSTQSQLKYLMSSEGYAGIEEEIQELIKANGELTADNIEELSDNCEDLDDILNNNILSAENLAKILTELTIGDIGIAALSEDIVTILKEVESLDGFFASNEKRRENFDEGRDLGAGYDWIAEYIEKALGFANNKEFGNENLESIAKMLFGEQWYNSNYALGSTTINSSNAMAAAYTSAFEGIQRLMENDGEGFAKILQSTGFLTYANGDYSFDSEQLQGGIDFFLGNVQTALQNKGISVGLDVVKALFERYIAQDPEVSLQYRQQQQKEAINEFIEKKEPDGFVLKSELEAFAEILGMTTEELEAKLGELSKLEVIDFSDEISDDERSKYYETAKGKIAGEEGTVGYDYETLVNLLRAGGLDDAQIESELSYLVNELENTITTSVFENGEFKQLALSKEPGETWAEAFERVGLANQIAIEQQANSLILDEAEDQTSLLRAILAALLNEASIESITENYKERYENAGADEKQEILDEIFSLYGEHFDEEKFSSLKGFYERETNPPDPTSNGTTSGSTGATTVTGSPVIVADNGVETSNVATSSTPPVVEGSADTDNPIIGPGDNETVKTPYTAPLAGLTQKVFSSKTAPLTVGSIINGLKAFGNWMNDVAERNAARGDYVADATMNPDLIPPIFLDILGKVINEGDFTGINPNEETLPSRSQEPDKIKEINGNTIELALTGIKSLAETYQNPDTFRGATAGLSYGFLEQIKAVIVEGFGSVQNFDNFQTVDALQASGKVNFNLENPEEVRKQILESVDLKELGLEDIAFDSMPIEEIITKITDATKAGIEDGSLTGVPLLASGLEEGVASTAPIVGGYLSTAIGEGGQMGAAMAQAAINSIYVEPLESTLTYYIQYIGGKAPSGAAGGMVPSYASGSENRKINPGTALTGEEEPEIVWNGEKGYAYMAGANGPELNNLQPGDRVFNGKETRDILKRSHKKNRPKIDTFISAEGGWNPPNSSSGSGGGGSSRDSSSGDKGTEWKNDFDWLYNLLEDIAELERDQKKLQEQFNDALKDSTKSAQDLVDLTVKEMKNLYSQKGSREAEFEQRQKEMDDYLAANEQYSRYATYNKEDGTIEIDWDAIEAIQDKDYYDDVKEYVEGIEEVQEKMDEAEDALLDIDNQIDELRDRFLQAYIDFENRIADAIIAEREKEIEALSNINDSINDTNGKLFEAIQKGIDQQRRDRENEKTEQNISEKERRLAYLRMDTSGSNEIEAKQLEEELTDLKQDYGDNLIDQRLSDLQDHADYAAEQRERQIELMQSQLDFEKENGLLWQEVNDLIQSSVGSDGKLLNDSALVTLLQGAENWKGLSEVQKEQWKETLNTDFNEAYANVLMATLDEFDLAAEIMAQDFLDEVGEISQAVQKISYGSSGNPAFINGGGGSVGSAGGGSSEHGTRVYNNDGTLYADYPGMSMGEVMNTFDNPLLHNYKEYATGGLNTSTGPAWLDGTPSKPELVLNARDTANFIQLKDILSDIYSGKVDSESVPGNLYFDIHVNAELKNDYDTEQLVKKIKNEIYQDGAYRGINVIHNIR